TSNCARPTRLCRRRMPSVMQHSAHRTSRESTVPSPNPEVARALVGNQATGSLTAWEPSLRDRIAYLLSDAAGYLGAGRYAQQDIAQKARDVIDFIPGVGEM